EGSNGKFSIKVGFIGKEAISTAEVEEYAKLPSKEVLISKLLFMLQSPMQRLAIAASEIAKKKESEEVA
ncbi:MAG: 50S ribosomal protein L10, partial [Ruminiclostridium sp.]